MSYRLPHALELGALLNKQLPPARPIISPWLCAGESCLLWAATGVGKSMFAQTLAIAAAGGGSVFNWNCPEPGRVLYVDGEQSERVLQRRFGLLSTAITDCDAAKAAGNLVVMARAAQGSAGDFLDLAEESQRTALVRYVKTQGFGLVVFDNLSTLTDKIDDENSAGAFKPVQALLTHLKKLNVAVILVHHAGKNPDKGFRGSSSIATTFERILGIRRKEAAPTTRIDATVTLEKFRDEVPEGFRSWFPVKFEKVTVPSGASRVVWEVGDLGELEESWRMFRYGSYGTRGEFVEAFNERFTASRSANNFSRDFVGPWVEKLEKTPADLREAERRMRMLRSAEQGAPEEPPRGDF